MIFVHCSKSAHAIGQNRSRVFWLPGNNESFECVITIMHEKCAVLKMARSKTSRKLYLQVDKVNKLMKISMNSTIKTKKVIFTKEVIKLSKHRLFSFFRL